MMIKGNPSFREIRSEEIIKTVQSLENRIEERFPDSGLSKITSDLAEVAEDAAMRSEKIGRPNIAIRISSWGLAVGISILIIWLLLHIPSLKKIPNAIDLIQAIEAGLASIVFIGASLIFLISLETRLKRKQAIKAIHELLSMAHIVDMHQLTKHPEVHLADLERTPSSPVRTYSTVELNRYFNYCIELLSLISKIGYAYVNRFTDAPTLNSVDQLGTLCHNLSTKIWQKIALVNNHLEDEAESKEEKENLDELKENISELKEDITEIKEDISEPKKEDLDE